MASKKHLIYPGDILAGVRTIFGPAAKVVTWDAEQGTEAMPGFLSVVLRAKVKIENGLGEVKDVNLMVKRKPESAANAAIVQDMSNGNIIARESIYFNKVLPRLLEKCPDLPIVRALVAHEEAIVMEDLCEAGFGTIAKSFSDIGRGGALTYPLAKMAVRKLAKLHAASLGTDWNEFLSESFFNPDPMMEGASAEQFKVFYSATINHVIIPIMRKMCPEDTNIDDFANYMSSPQFFTNAIRFVKFDPDFSPNVLSHGDFYVNNMMFKMDKEKNNAVDMRVIDFQITRYAPPTADLINFLYINAGLEFRDKYESDLLKAYVEAFNTEACVTPDLLDLEKLTAQYDKSRYLGAVISLGVRPMLLMPNAMPMMPTNTDGEQKAPGPDDYIAVMQQMQMMMALAIEAFDEDPFFNKEMKQLISHSMDVMRKYVSSK